MKNKNKKTKVYSISEELDKAKKYTAMFTKANNFSKERFADYAELMAFYQGNQHLLKKYKSDRPWIINMNTPYATIAIENRIASLLVNDYEGDLLPLSPEDIDVIEPIDRVYKREWERMNLDTVIRHSVEKCAVVREAYCHIKVNEHKIYGGRKNKRIGALEAEMIEPSCVLIDPNARNLRDASYCIVTGRIGKKEALKKYDILEGLRTEAYAYQPSDRGEIYYDNDYTTEQEDVFTVWNFYIKQDGKIKKVKLINNIIVNESELNLTRFPIAQIRWKKAAQSCYGISLMDQLLSLQKAICSIESAITNTAVAYAAPSLMVGKGSGVDPKVVAKSNGAPGVVYSVNGNLDNAIKPVVPPKIQDEILSIKNDYERKIKEISGNTGQFLGDIGTAANTASGAEISVDRAKIIEVNAINNISEYVEDIANIIIEFIIKLYPNSELTYNNGRNGRGEYVFDVVKMPSKKEMKDIEYLFHIELDKKSQYSQDRQKQELMDLFQFERQYDAPIKTVTVADIIKNSNIENKDEILERFNQLNSQDAATKAETIQKIISSSNDLGISPELVTQAITEIIAGGNDTPATNELMKQLNQGFEAQIQEAQAQADMGAVPEGTVPNASPEALAMADEMLGGQVPM